MYNRIASLFALDELLGAKTNGHNGNGAAKRRRRALRKRAPNAPSPGSPGSPVKSKPTRSPYQHYGKRTGKSFAQSFDTGAPIRCEHGVPYTPVEPVQVPSESVPGGAAMSFDVGDGGAGGAGAGYTVEAFDEEEEEDLPLELPDLDEEDYSTDEYSVESSHSAPYHASAPRTFARGDYERSQPAAFAAQMSAVERDLADLATRVQSPATTPSAATPASDEEQAAADGSPAAPVNTSGHGVFDAMAQGMSYATEFRLPALQLSQVFTALDKQLDREEAASAPVAVAPPSAVGDPAAIVVEPLPPNDVLIKDLVDLPAGSDATAATAVAAAAIDVRHDVQLVPQLTGFSCWAAGAAMLVGWREQMSIDPSEIARASGYWAQYAAGLHPEDVTMFKLWRLTPEPAQTYTVQGFADLLQKHGPLWVASAEPGPHIRVVTGLVGDGTATGTLVYINDPWEQGMHTFRPGNRGSRYTETYQRFVEKQSELGRRELKLQGIYVAHN